VSADPAVPPAYDTIGEGYAAIRRPEPRFAARIEAALGEATTVVNVGAGAGSYEPAGREVTAVEPSALMISQRREGAAPVVQAHAEALPFEDDSFDAAMAVLTIHHWNDAPAGLAEMRRVARERIVIFTLEAAAVDHVWMVADYFPSAGTVDHEVLPPVNELLSHLPGAEVEVVPAPRHCRDGFTIALWDRPELLLDPVIRRSSSVWHDMPDEEIESGVERLREELANGEWDRKHGHLRERDELDVGLRLISAPAKTPR
jgi:SAM-dependent methyltransferase